METPPESRKAEDGRSKLGGIAGWPFSAWVLVTAAQGDLCLHGRVFLLGGASTPSSPRRED